MDRPLSAFGSSKDNGDITGGAAAKAARANRFTVDLPGNRFKELDEQRRLEMQQPEEEGEGRGEEKRGSCEQMCSEYEIHSREAKQQMERFERVDMDPKNKRIDPQRAVAVYKRSEAGAGEGELRTLASDLRTPAALVMTLDYLFGEIMSIPPLPSLGLPSTGRTALGSSIEFIMNRSRAVRKEFAMQTSWGQEESISSHERIARWHILCLRELQEDTGTHSDMHQDSAELGFMTLRLLYNDRREETQQEMPCPNEPEFVAYMLIYDLTSTDASIPISQLPSVILDHPLVKVAWEIRRAAQRNFDTQKEGRKSNVELGANLITRFIRLLKHGKVPYLLAALVEVRLREIRRSALRALTQIYPRFRQGGPIRYGDKGDVVERRIFVMDRLERMLGCEEQEDEPPGYGDVDDRPETPTDEAADVIRAFDLDVHHEGGEPNGAIINMGAGFQDNNDAPYTRRWKMITDKRAETPFVDIVNGAACVQVDGAAVIPPRVAPVRRQTVVPIASATPKPVTSTTAFSFNPPASTTPTTAPSAFSFTKPTAPPVTVQPAVPPATPSLSQSAFSFDFGKPKLAPPSATAGVPPPIIEPKPATEPPKIASFDFGLPSLAPRDIPKPVAEQPPPSKPSAFDFGFSKPPMPAPTAETPKSTPPANVYKAPALLPLTPDLATAPVASSSKLPSPAPPASPTAIKLPSRTPSLTLSQSIKGKQREHLGVSQLRRSTGLNTSESIKRRKVLPDLANSMIAEAVNAFLEDFTPDLARMVRQEASLRAVTADRQRRQNLIRDISERIFDTMRAEALTIAAKEALLHELRQRTLVRQSVHHWRGWARSRTLEREVRKKARRDAFARLTVMGLGSDGSVGESSLSDRRGVGMSEDGDLSVDVELRENARLNDRLRQPATFVSVIARFIGPLLDFSYPEVPSSPSSGTPQGDLEKIRWNTILSTAQDSATPSAQAVTDWLISKFSPRAKNPVERFGCVFDTNVVGRYDQLPEESHGGLVVFDTSLATDDQRDKQENASDAQDRFKDLRKLLGESNRYNPALLFVTWENEGLDAIIERLEIQEDIEGFEQIGVLSLQFTADIDMRLEQILAETVPYVSVKERLEVPIHDVLQAISPAWAEFTAVSSVIVERHPQDAQIPLKALQAGIEAINFVSSAVNSVLGKLKRSTTSSFSPLALPAFEAPSIKLTTQAAEVISDYLDSHDIYNEIDDLKLSILPLHHAAVTGQALPISPILASLAFLVFGEMASQSISLRVFLPEDEIRARVGKITASIKDRYTEHVNQAINDLTRYVPLPPSPSSIPLRPIVNGTSPTRSTVSDSPSSRGIKRLRADDHSSDKLKESTSSKAAKLLKLIQDSQNTMEGIETAGWSDGVLAG